MNDFSTRCFVCQKEIDQGKAQKNMELNLPVCKQCEGSEKEKKKVKELTEGLADDFVCGCI